MRMYLLIAARNLLQAPRRTLLLGSALTGVAMLLVLLLGLAQGITDTMRQTSTMLVSGDVNVAGFSKTRPSEAMPVLPHAQKLRKLVAANTPGLDYIIDRSRGWGKVISDTQVIQSGISGIDAADESRFLSSIQLAKESEYHDGGRDKVVGDVHKLSQPGQILIFAAQAKRLNVIVGDPLTLTVEMNGGRTNTTDVTVAAVARDIGFMSNWSTFVSKSTLQALYHTATDTTGDVMVYLKNPDRSNKVMGHLRNVLEAHGYKLLDYDPRPFFMKFETVANQDWTGERLDLTTWRDEVSFLQWVINAVQGVSIFLISILAFIIAIGIMNTMYIAVRERTAEIGTSRAIGMSRGRVLGLFLTESLLLSFAASTVGGLLGWIVAVALDAAHIHIPIAAVRLILLSDTLHMAVHPLHVVSAVVAFTILSALASLLPALRASKLQPVVAMGQGN